LVFVGTSLVLLEVSSEESMLTNLPTQEEIIQAMLDRSEQMSEIDQLLEEQMQVTYDQEAEYETLFSYDVRHTFIIQFTQEEWDGLLNDMYDYYNLYGTYKSNNYHKVDVLYVADGNVTEINDVGIRTKGNDYSRRPPEDASGNVIPVHYMLKFNETFDLLPGTEEYDALKTREVFNIEQLLMKWNNTNDPSYTNEVYSYEALRQAGVPMPRASWAEVRIVIEGRIEQVTLYKIFEHYDEEFIRKHLQETPTKTVGDLYKGLWSATLDPIQSSEEYGVRDWETNYRPLYGRETNKLSTDYTTLVDFSWGINIGDLDARKEFIEANFNIDNFMRASAMNVLLGNPDDYRSNANNFYYYFDEDGYMTYLPFDLDNSLGSGWAGHEGFINYTLGNDIYEWNWPDWMPCGKPLWDNTIVYEEYQLLYEQYLLEFIESGIYSYEAYEELYNKTESLYGDFNYFYLDKEDYFNTKISAVLEDVEYYQSNR
jgi:spore coat protein CotH